MTYQILVSRDSDELASKVNAAIDKGWTPIGGVSASELKHTWEQRGYTETEECALFSQAMTKNAQP